jgi:hypothetical protein
MDGLNLTVSGVATVNGSVTMSTGDLQCNSNLTVGAAGVVSSSGSGTMAVTGLLNNSNSISGASGTMTFSGAATNSGTITGGSALLTFGSSLTSTGTVEAGAVANGSDAIRVVGNANFSGGTLTGNGVNNPYLRFNDDLVFSAGSTITQDGDIIRFGGTVQQNISMAANAFDGVRVENSANSIVLQDDMSITGVLSLVDGILNLNGQTLTLGADPVLTADQITVGTGTLDASGSNLVTGAGSTITVSTGAVNCDDLTVTAGSLVCSGAATITCDGAVTLTTGTFTSSTSTLVMTGPGTTLNATDNPNNLQISSNVSLLTNPLVVNGTLLVDAGDTFDMDGLNLTVSGVATVNGSVTMSTGDLQCNSNLTVGAAGVVSSSGSGTMAVTGLLNNSNSISGASGTMTFSGAATNSGTITGGSALLTFGSSLTSTGTVEAGAVANGSDAIRVVGNANFSGGTLTGNGVNNPYLRFNDDLVFSAGSTITQDGDIIRFGGTVQQNISMAANAFEGVRVENSANSIVLQDDMSITGVLSLVDGILNLNGQTLTLGADPVLTADQITVGTGTLDASGSNLVTGAGSTITVSTGAVNCDDLTVTAGSLVCSGAATITCDGAVTLTTGTFTSSTSTLVMTGPGTTLNATDNPNNLQISSNVSLLTNPLVVNGTLLVDAGDTFDMDGLNLTVSGVATVNGSVTMSTGDLQCNNNLTVGAAGVVSSSGSGTMAVTGLLNNSNSISGASGTMTFSGAATNSGTITGGSALLTFGSSLTSTGTVEAGAVANGSDAIRVVGNANFSGGTLTGNGVNNPYIRFENNVIFNGASLLTQNDDILLFGNNSNQTLTSALGFEDIEVNKSGNVLNLVSSVSYRNINLVTGTIRVGPGVLLDVNDTLTQSGGVIDCNTNNNDTDIENDFSMNGGTWDITGQQVNIAGNWDIQAGAVNMVGSTVVFDGAAGTQTVETNGISFHDVTVTASAGRIVQLLDSLNIGNDFIFNNGTLDLAGQNINIGNNMSFEQGNFYFDNGAGGNVLAVTGDLDINGGTFREDAGTNISAGSQITVGGSLTLDCTNADINMNGSAGWILAVTGTAYTFDSGANVINASLSNATISRVAAANAADGGGTINANCTNWDVNRPQVSAGNVRTLDDDADGQIDYIMIITDTDPVLVDGLNDDFTGFTSTVGGGAYPVLVYDSNPFGPDDNDYTFYIDITESGSPDTGATPAVIITATGSLRDLAGNHIITGALVATSDYAPPKIVAVDFSIDDPPAFDPSPYYDDITGAPQDPGSGPWNFNMYAPGSTNEDFVDYSYHNTIQITFSEDVDLDTGFYGIPQDSQAGGYNYAATQRSGAIANTLGNTVINGANMEIDELGLLLGAEFNVEPGYNFVQLEDLQNLYIHVAGWYDGADFPGSIISTTSIPRSGGGPEFFQTQVNANIHDLAAIPNDLAANSALVQVSFTNDWDVAPPEFRFIPPTVNYKGDPDSSSGPNLSTGSTYGNLNTVSRVEFVMSEAILDLPDTTDLAGVFNIRYFDEATPATSLEFVTEVLRLGDTINDYDEIPPTADSHINDQGFSVTFDVITNKPASTRVAWTYNQVAGKLITDLRGNRLAEVTIERVSMENGPPEIAETRAVVGSNLMYVEFNEQVRRLNPPPGESVDILASNFIYENNYSSGVSIIDVLDVSDSSDLRKKFIFTLNTPMTENHIVNDRIRAKQDAVKDSLMTTMSHTQTYPVSEYGIEFFTNIILDDYLHKNKYTRVEKFDGTMRILNESMRVTATVDVEKYDGVRPVLYYDVRDSESESIFWLPKDNQEARMVIGVSKGNNRWEFVIPSSDVKLQDDGALVSMVLKIGDYYCFRAPYPLDDSTFTPYDAETYRVKIEKLAIQNSEVTILNNVINSRRGERTKLRYKLSKAGPVSIVVYDIAGNTVRVLRQKSEAAGVHSVEWDGKNSNGQHVARGVYMIRIRAPQIFNQIRKVLIIR